MQRRLGIVVFVTVDHPKAPLAPAGLVIEMWSAAYSSGDNTRQRESFLIRYVAKKDTNPKLYGIARKGTNLVFSNFIAYVDAAVPQSPHGTEFAKYITKFLIKILWLDS